MKGPVPTGAIPNPSLPKSFKAFGLIIESSVSVNAVKADPYRLLKLTLTLYSLITSEEAYGPKISIAPCEPVSGSTILSKVIFTAAALNLVPS